MSIQTNLGSISTGANQSSGTDAFFTNIAQPLLSVSQNIDDAGIGFFQEITETKESAKALAGAVIATSLSQGVNPMDTIKEFSRLSTGELNSYITMFLNLNRVGTSYLGINNSPQASKYVTRMIRP